MAAADRRLHESIVALADVPGLPAVWQAAAEAMERFRLADTSDDGSLADDPLARACIYLDFHTKEAVQLAFVAEHVSRTSPGHLGRLFRQKYVMSFTEYVRALRLHEAVGLLTTTSQPIGRIAKIVGYADSSRFGAHFRQRYWLTPWA